MSSVTALPWGRPLTREDLDAMPDDGHRYELLDGMLLVSPAPRPLHQRVVLRVARLLEDACPAEFEVLIAPLDVVLADDTVLQPDVLVARRADLTDRDLPAPPVLAVEVLSPSTRRVDLLLKRSRYESAGIPTYLVLDPDEPSVTAWSLLDGTYVDAGAAAGGRALHLDTPCPVRVVPGHLVAVKPGRP